MATIGLKIADDPYTGSSLSLADTLAKGIFGDPEGQMKARALAAQVNAHQAYAGNLNEKTREDQIAQHNRDVAGPAVGEAGAAAVPMPVAVDLPRPSPTFQGPMPQGISPHDQAVHDALVRRERALGPILVQGNPNEVAEGINKNYGGTILSAAAANPAIVSGDSLRIAGGMMTGSAPTTSTVWSAGDTSGVDAAAREKILEARGTPQKPDVKEFDGTPYVINADGSIAPAQGFVPKPKDPERQMIGDVLHERQPDGSWAPVAGQATPKIIMVGDTPMIEDPKTGALTPAPGGPKPAPKLVTVGPDTAQQNPDGTLTTPTVQGRVPIEDKIFAGNSTTDEALNFTTDLGVKMGDPKFVPTPKQAAAYSSAYNHLYEQPKAVEYKREDGSTGVNWVISPAPVNSVSPAEVYKRIGAAMQASQPAAQPPVAGPPVAAPPVQTPVQTVQAPVQEGPRVGTVVNQPLTGPVDKPLTTEEEKAQGYLTMGHDANTILTKLTPKTIPSGFEVSKADYASSPGITGSLVGAITGDAAKEYNGAAKAFIEAYARPATGATISPMDYKNFYGALIPLPTDPQSEFDRKTRLRAELEDVWINGSGFHGQAQRDAWFAKHAGPINTGGGGGGGGGGGKPPISSFFK